MDVAMSKMSSNGQIVIPAGLRRRLGLGPDTKFLVIEEGGTLVLKPLGKQVLRREFSAVLADLQAAFRRAGLSRGRVEREIRAARRGKR